MKRSSYSAAHVAVRFPFRILIIILYPLQYQSKNVETFITALFKVLTGLPSALKCIFPQPSVVAHTCNPHVRGAEATWAK